MANSGNLISVYDEPNSSIHFSYFSRSSFDTDLLHFCTASRKS